MVARSAKPISGQHDRVTERAEERDSIPVESGTRPRVREAAVEESNLVGVETSKARFYMFVAPRSGKKTA